MSRSRHPLLHRARASARGLTLAGVTFGLLGAQAAHARLSPPAARAAVFQRYMRVWARALIHAFGGRLRVRGQVPPPNGHGRLVVSNHRSPFDIAILLQLFGGNVVSRADLASWPVLGVAAREAGTIFVDRADSRSGASAIRAIRRRLLEGGTVVVFPEGGTHTGDEVRPFKGGAFVALRGVDADIVPVGLAYDPGVEYVENTFGEHLAHVAGRPQTRCAVRIGETQLPEVRAASTAAHLQQHVQTLVHEARADWLAWPR